MALLVSIEPAEREFFEIVAQTAFCNPFSERRAELDAQIVGHPVEPFSEAHVDAMTGIISARLQKLEAQGGSDLRKFSAPDRDLMRPVFLFELFHQFHRDFDQLILEQVK